MASVDIVASLVLGAFAVFVITVGAAVQWITTHHDRLRTRIDSLHARPWVASIRRRYHKQIVFLVRRLQPEGAFGLSFTLGLGALVACTWIFGGVLEDVIGHEEIAIFDAPIVSYVAEHRAPWLTLVMLGATHLGEGLSLALLTLTAALISWRKKRGWRPMLLIAGAAGGASLLDVVMKVAVNRPRPPLEWMATDASGSAFPSGHTTLSTAVFGMVAYLAMETRQTWKTKTAIWAVAAVAAFLVGISRIYLGAHWPTDVMSGWALGSAWLVILITTTTTIERVQRGSSDAVAGPS